MTADTQRQVDKFYREHAQRLRRALSSFPGTIAEDAVQCAFEKLCQRADVLATDTVTGWLFTVARNEAIHLCGQDRSAAHLARVWDTGSAHGVEGVEYDPPSPVTIEDQVEARDALRQVAALRPVRKRVFERHLAGLTYEEIVAEQGLTYTNVNRQVVDSRTELRAAA